MQRPDPSVGERAFTIRPAVESDAHAVVPLFATLGYPAPAEAIVARLWRLTTFAGHAVALVAAGPEGNVVGLVTAHALASVHADAPTVWLTTLVTDQQLRGRGVGRGLVRAAEAWAADHGAIRVSVSSGLHRGEAHRFHEALGYVATGRRFTRSLDVAQNAGGPSGPGAA